MNGPKLPSCVEPWWSEKTDAQKTDAQRQIDDLLSGKTKPLDVGEIEHAAEVAAAEERGRRRGEAERDELRALLKEWLPRQCALKPWPPIGSMLACGKCLGCRTLIALAPRDSAPAHEPWCEANVVGPCECKPRDSGKEAKEENAGRWVLPGGSTGFVEPPAICNACGEPLLTCNLYCDDGCPCNSPRGVNVKPAACSLCRTDNCVKPAHRLWEARDSTRLNPAMGFASRLPGDRK